MKQNRSFIFIFLILCFSITLFGGEKKKEFKIPYEKYKLSNGLNVILHIDKSDPIAAVYVVYHVGSAREVQGKTGFAHLFEHLRFNESQDIPQGQWFKKLQTAGASIVNGSTNTDRTNYFEVVPKNAVEMALWMESDRMGFLLSKVNQETFVTQQNVVQNEKRQGDNRAYSQSQYMSTKLMYPATHPYSHTVIGQLEDLAAASLQDVFDFHAKYYAPSNATLIVSGDIDVAQTKKWIDKYFAEIKSEPAPAPLAKMSVTLKETVRAYCEDNLANAPRLGMEFPTVEEFNKDAYALEFFGRIFAGSKKSPLYKVIVEEKKLAPNVMARQGSDEVAGSFDISITAFPKVKLGDVEAGVKEAFLRFEKDGFTDKDIERQKAGIEYSFYNQSASVLGKAMRLGDYNIFKGSPDYMATDLKDRMSVTKDDVWRVYNKYIKGENYLITSIVQKGKPELAAPDSKLWVVQEESIEKQGTKKKEVVNAPYVPIPSKIDRTKEPMKGKDPILTLPKIWKDKTKNGIEVFGIKQSELPLVQFSIILKGGMLLDNPDKIGVASLTARLMNEGTKTKTPVELREAIQDLGANINIQGEAESITISGGCLANKLNETFALAKEMIFEPRWDANEFELAKNQTIEGLKRTETAPTSIARSVFEKLVYGTDNILANEPAGSIKSVEAITLDDLKKYYDQYFSPSVAKVMIVGDITKEKAVALFNGLKDWNSKEVKIPASEIVKSAKPGIYFVDVPKAKQSQVFAGHIGPSSTDPDFYKAVVINQKLGGDFSGILNMILREKKSFTYGARSGFTGNAYAGLFLASSAVQANSTFESTQIVRDEIKKYQDGISKEDLDQVKSALLKSNAGKFETLMQLSGMLQPVVMYNLPFNYIKQRETVVQKMTPEEHMKLTQKFIHPDKLIYVIVGDKESQFAKLKELGLGDPVLLDKDGKPVSQ
ncbi:MAG: pitrilysin family protein [Ignavibacteriales bacterium]|nr:pitrilysin family protein [Ignavibacteriales bacterium]